MKKTFSFLTIAILMLMMGCQKTDDQPSIPNAPEPAGNLKDAALIPIHVGRNNPSGTLIVENIPTGFLFTALLAGWEFLDSHIYIGTEAPPSPAPGQFPYSGTIGIPASTLSFFIPYEELGATCGTFYIAFHADVTNGEDTEGAWAIHSINPLYWYNPAGKKIGWGAYFAFTISCGPQITVTTTTQDLSSTYGYVRYRNMNENTDEEPEVHVFPDVSMPPFIPPPINFSSSPDCSTYEPNPDGRYLFENQPNHIGFQYTPPIELFPSVLQATIYTNYFYCAQVPVVVPGVIDAIQLVITDRANELDVTNIVLTNVNINGTNIDGDFHVELGDGEVRFNFTGDILMVDGGFVFQADLMMNYQVPTGSFDMNFVELKFGQE